MDRDSFIHTMRAVATPVTIVCTNGVLGRHGATVSAMCSVSADPPSLLICLNSRSGIARFVEENGAFSVNLISEGQSNLACAFAGRQDVISQRTFATDNWFDGPMALPTLRSASAVFYCLVKQCYQHSTHRLVIGRVVEAVRSDDVPLTYYDGEFCQLGLPEPAASTTVRAG
jgi:flavin reductase (DIM6/NTAB) family NADH-FMN oxidoreductase RutF